MGNKNRILGSWLNYGRERHIRNKMEYKEYKDKLIKYINSGLSYPEDKSDEEIEEFFEFIDELEAKAETDKRYFELVSDAWALMKDYKKAYEAFDKFHDPTNSKHLKKLYSYDKLKSRPVIRPSKRVKKLPAFQYVDKKVLSDMFISSRTKACCICGGKKTALYAGIAYDNKDGKEILFADKDEKFCADCIKDGKAADQLDICFNSPLIRTLTAMDKEKIDVLTKNTPTCSIEFEIFNEDIWITCCDDFCCYKKKVDDIFHFQCIHCGKKIKLVEES